MDSFIKSLVFNLDIYYTIIDQDDTTYCLHSNPNGTFIADEGYPPRFYRFANADEVYNKFRNAKSIVMSNIETDEDIVLV